MVFSEGDASLDLSSIRNCTFIDFVMISEEVGVVSFEDSITLPCGLSDTTFRNCFLFPGIAVHKNTYVENSVVLKGSILMGCGRITCQSETLCYGNTDRGCDLRKRRHHQHGQ